MFCLLQLGLVPLLTHHSTTAGEGRQAATGQVSHAKSTHRCPRTSWRQASTESPVTRTMYCAASRQTAPAFKPFGDAARARQGGGNEAEIAGIAGEARAGTGPRQDRLQRVAGIVEASSGGNLRHELGNADCASFLLTTSSRSPLSCHIRLAKNGTGADRCSAPRCRAHCRGHRARNIAAACRLSFVPTVPVTPVSVASESITGNSISGRCGCERVWPPTGLSTSTSQDMGLKRRDIEADQLLAVDRSDPQPATKCCCCSLACR